MNILITGGAGFIGHHAARAFLAAGHAVVILDDLSRPGSAINAAELVRMGARHEHGFVQDGRSVMEAFWEKPDVVLHLAGQPAVTTSVENPWGDFEANAAGTVRVLEAVRRWAPEALTVFASTNKVYGAIPAEAVPPGGVPERCALDFHSPYGCSKGAADSYVRDYARIYGLRTVVLRLSCVYGPEQYGLEGHAWVAWFATRAMLGERLTLFGDGQQVRDVLYVDDLVNLLQRLATDARAGEGGAVFNVGGGPKNAVSLIEALAMIRGVFGWAPRLEWAPARPGDQARYVTDIGKVAECYGWAPTVGPAEGIRRLCEWINAARDRLHGMAA